MKVLERNLLSIGCGGPVKVGPGEKVSFYCDPVQGGRHCIGSSIGRLGVGPPGLEFKLCHLLRVHAQESTLNAPVFSVLI